jgi:Signal transduction histidine kinase
MSVRPHNPRHGVIWCAGTFGGAAFAQLVSTALWDHQNATHVVWFPGAVILGALLSTPRPYWPSIVVSGYAGLVMVLGLLGLPLADVALLAIPNVAFIPLVAWCMRSLPRRVPPLQDFHLLTVFTLLAVIALPAVGTGLMATLSPFSSLEGMLEGAWANLATAQALGYALYVPAWCSVRARESALRDMGGVDPGLAILLTLATVMLTIAWYAFGDLSEYRPLLCIAPTPIVFAAVLGAQVLGSSVVMFVIGLVAAHLTSRGYGPFAVDSLHASPLALQLWTLLAAISALAVALVVEQRSAGRRSLIAAHRDLRELAGRLIATQEQERGRLARDLHDDINQRLAAASIDLSALNRGLGPEHQQRVIALQDRIVGLSDDVRALSHQLHPSCLQHAGLYVALENLCRRPNGHAWPRVRLVADSTIDQLCPNVALCFYRVAQEALANAVRHADASEITLHASVDAGIATLRIVDDGKGLAVDACTATRTGIGLTSMDERAKLLGGSFRIHSAPGKGVDVCVKIPMTTT